MVFNTDLMSDSNWAYFASMEVVKDIYEDVNLLGPVPPGTSAYYGS